MISRITQTAALLPGRWKDEGNVLCISGSSSLRAMEVTPERTSSIEYGLDGPETNAFFSRLSDALGQLPSKFEAQVILVRERYRASEDTAESEHFPTTGFSTRAFLVEQVTKKLGEGCLSQGLVEAGFELRNLSIEEFGGLRLRILGVTESTGPHSLPDLIWEGSHIRVNDRCLKVVSLTDSPQYTTPGLLQPLFDLPAEFVFSIRLRVPDRIQARKALERKRRVSHALASTKGRELVDLGSGATLSASEETLMRLIEGKESILDLQACFILQAATLAEVEAQAARLVSMAGLTSGIGLFAENVGSLPVLRSHIPGNACLAAREIKMLSGNAAHVLPLLVDRFLSLSPAPITVVSRSMERCSLALFSPENHNFNLFACGSSGSGKSFLVNSLIASLKTEEPNSQVTVFDVGGSYRKLVANLGGKSLDLSAEQARKLVNSHLRSQTLAPTTYMRSILETLCGSGEHITHSHRVAIENILSDCSGAPFSIRLLASSCVEHPEAAYRDIALWLQPFTSWDDLPVSRFDLEALAGDIRAFDFRQLDGDPMLQRLVLLTLVHDIWSRLKRGEAKRTLVVFDEVWKLLAEARTFLEDMYRTFRKNGASVVSVTQNIADFGENDFARIVISNSFTRILLQGSGTSSLLTKMLDLSESDLARVLSLSSRKGEFSEFWTGTPERSQIMRLIASESLYKLAHTENISVTEQKEASL